MTRSRNIGILGGSFNPVHIGHLLLADYLVQFTGLDEVWLMLSPQNPLKVASANELIPDAERLRMLSLACSKCNGIKPCDIELAMPRPNFTIDSLSILGETHPDCCFRLIVGSDNWNIFNRWRDYEAIINRFHPMVYPRPGYTVDVSHIPPNVTIVEAPVFDISSTFIRRAIAQGHDMHMFLPTGVWNYIKNNKLYGYGKPVISTGA